MSGGLTEVRITAERVQRFADLIADEPTDRHHRLWHAAMHDLEQMVAHALQTGVDENALRATCGDELWDSLAAMAHDSAGSDSIAA